MVLFGTSAITLTAAGNPLFWFMFPLIIIFWKITKDIFVSVASVLVLASIYLGWTGAIQVNPIVAGTGLLAYVVYCFYYFSK